MKKGRLIIHAGQMKSSTTYIQSILSNNRVELLEKGTLYPGKQENQQILLYQVLGEHIYWRKNKPVHSQHFEALLKVIRENISNGKDVIISSEALSSMDEKGIRFFHDKLGGFDEVILTIRSLYKTLPSAWQQTLKSGNTDTLDKFFSDLTKDRDKKKGYWRTYSYGNTSLLWSKFANVSSVIIPNSTTDEKLSWKSFIKASGINEPDKVIYPKKEENTSFSFDTARFIRAVSQESFEIGLDKRNVARWYYNNFINGSSTGKNKILPPKKYLEPLNNWCIEETEALKENSVNIIGDISELTTYNGNWIDEIEKKENISKLELELANQICNNFIKVKNDKK